MWSQVRVPWKNINSLEREPTSLRNSKTEGRKYYTQNLGHAHSSADTLDTASVDIEYQRTICLTRNSNANHSEQDSDASIKKERYK